MPQTCKFKAGDTVLHKFRDKYFVSEIVKIDRTTRSGEQIWLRTNKKYFENTYDGITLNEVIMILDYHHD